RALAQYGENLERFEREGGYAVTARIDAVLHGLEFDPAQARVTPLSALSGGELGRLGLARQLMSTANVLLLDEPTNHLDLETTQWLEQYLAASERTVLLVSHDRAFLAATVDHVLHLEGGTATHSSVSIPSTAANCVSAGPSRPATTGKTSRRCPSIARCTRSSPRCGQSGSAVRYRDTSDVSDSPVRRCCAGQTPCRAANAPGSRSRC